MKSAEEYANIYYGQFSDFEHLRGIAEERARFVAIVIRVQRNALEEAAQILDTVEVDSASAVAKRIRALKPTDVMAHEAG